MPNANAQSDMYLFPDGKVGDHYVGRPSDAAKRHKVGDLHEDGGERFIVTSVAAYAGSPEARVRHVVKLAAVATGE